MQNPKIQQWETIKKNRVNKKLQKLGIIQAVLKTLSTNLQNTKISITIYSN